MRKSTRRIAALFLSVVLSLSAVIPASAANERKQKAPDCAAVIQSWSECVEKTFGTDKLTCLKRLSDDDAEAISDRLSKSSKVYLVKLSDGRYTYYMAVDFRTDDAVYLRYLGVMRKTSHKLYDRSAKMAKKNKSKSPVLMDYTHIVGELGAHYVVYRITDDLGGASLNGLLGKLYRSSAVANLNIDEGRMPVMIRVLGYLIGE